MSGFLLDTVAVSEATRRQANRGLASWLDKTDESTTYICSLTIGELQKGIVRLEPGLDRRTSLERWLARDLIARFGERILAFDVPAALTWGTLVAVALDRHAALSVIDSQIAAVAHVHGLTVVTRNESHFSGTGVPVLNPWT